MILGGDSGGTKTNLGLFAAEGEGLRLLRSATFASAQFAGLAPIVKAFLDESAPLEAACFGIAGPIVGNRVSTPNLAWEIDGAQLACELGLAPSALLLINDLVATAEGIPLLGPAQLETLQEGNAGSTGNRVLIAAGTGLGMCLLPRVGSSWLAVPSEGGHADFAPRDEQEIGLLVYLRERFGGHVSVERVLAGPGLVNIYDYLRDSGWAAEGSAMRARMATEPSARVVAEAGATGEDRLSARALAMFSSAYGAAAGNLALIGTAEGGVFLGGGIAPKILPILRGDEFHRAFRDKGRFNSYLARIPVRVILEDRTAMLGAARRAAALAKVQI